MLIVFFCSIHIFILYFKGRHYIGLQKYKIILSGKKVVCLLRLYLNELKLHECNFVQIKKYILFFQILLSN